MKNLEQIRAKNALNVKINSEEGESDSIAKKVPAMIMTNGILAAAAFALNKQRDFEKKPNRDMSKKPGYVQVFEAIIHHLQDKEIHLLDVSVCSLEKFIATLTTDTDSCKLRLITAETMAYLNYLRRFA